MFSKYVYKPMHMQRTCLTVIANDENFKYVHTMKIWSKILLSLVLFLCILMLPTDIERERERKRHICDQVTIEIFSCPRIAYMNTCELAVPHRCIFLGNNTMAFKTTTEKKVFSLTNQPCMMIVVYTQQW